LVLSPFEVINLKFIKVKVSEPKLIPELACIDYKRSLSFYTEILGFKVLYCREEEGFAMLEINGAKLMIDQIGLGRNWSTGDMEYPLGRGINLQIEVTDVEAIYKKLSFRNYDIFLEIEEKWYRKQDSEVGNKQFIVQDPDGYLLRFFEDIGERKVL
jgi:catechol 2,3-dioxygenase-like lactoylglutathione lyase family enzyme